MNEEVLQAVGTQTKLVDALTARTNKWLRHVLRHDSPLRTLLEGRLQGMKGSEKPRTTFLNCLLKNDEGKIYYDQLEVSAQDRISWCQCKRKPAQWAEYYW